ncbi:hypothetical protein [Sulfuriferula plumbiphila]|uniref:hypothetical protein n=1 Tax=Sulfuriferula plumbiphila TaxID=171865 RepID=UPI003FCDE281
MNGRVGCAGQAGATRFSLGAGYDKTNGGFSAARPGTFGLVADDDGARRRNASLSLEHALNAGNSIGLSGFYNHDRVEYDAGTANDYAQNQVSSWPA